MRFARTLWLVVFLIPLGLFADRFCYINLVDPIYHSLMWLHERLPALFTALALLSAAAAAVRYVRIRRHLRALETLRSDPPPSVRTAFQNIKVGRGTIKVVYIDSVQVFCFTVYDGRVVLSRGFAELLDEAELRLVAYHEALHVARGDPMRALLWHLLFAALILPGFEPVEELLYAHRERAVDQVARKPDPSRYSELLRRFGPITCGSVPGAAFRSLTTHAPAASVRILAPVAVPVALFVLLVTSQVLFVQNLPYLRTHHC